METWFENLLQDIAVILRCALALLYDVLSTPPYFGQVHIQPQKIQKVMSVRGSSGQHYRWQNISGWRVKSKNALTCRCKKLRLIPYQ